MEIIAALQNQTRLEILTALSEARSTVTQLADQLDLDASTVSHALQKLRKHNLVQYHVLSRTHIYQLSPRVRMESDKDGALIRISDDGVEIAITTRR